ncbi:GGDEF domain-containing protein [Kineococcus auxinigenes]
MPARTRPDRSGEPWWAPRDGAAGTRAAGALALFGALYMVLGALLIPSSTNGSRWGLPASVAAAALLAAISAVPALAPRRVPGWSAVALVLVGVAEILALDLVTVDTSASAQVFLWWPAIYAAYHLRRAAAWAVAATCLAAQVALLLVLAGPGLVGRDTPAWAVTAAVVTAMVSGARDRQAALLEDLRAEAGQDGLTGLSTRRAFDDALARHLRQGSVGALVLVDVDRFKEVNDEHGHAAGDAVLRTVAGELRAVCRPGDVVARLGGDELAALLVHADPRPPAGPGTTCPLALAAAERFRAAVAGLRVPTPDGSPGPRLSVSVGVAGGGLPGETPEHLLARADAALYAAKRGGRNRVVAGSAPPAAPPGAPSSAPLPGRVGGGQ